MPKRTLTVFLCSTYEDLQEEREKVLDAVRRLQLQHDSMEFFGARSDRPIETCLEEVRKSDVIVVIVGHRYGSIVPELGISYSEAEYREAHNLGKPSLVYVRSDSVPVLPKFVEQDSEKAKLLRQWKDTLNSRHTVAPFEASDTLAVQVAADLGRTVEALRETAEKPPAEEESPSDTTTRIGTLVESAISDGLSPDLAFSTIRRALDEALTKMGIRRPQVFLSHSHADKEIVRAFSKALKENRVDTWIDEAELQVGDSLQQKIEEGLDSADFVAFFMSQKSMESAWAQKELNVAISKQISGDRGAVVLPILLDDVQIPALLRDVLYIDLRDRDVGRGVGQIMKAIETHSLEIEHTYAVPTNRYYNPAEKIEEIGRRIEGDSFPSLIEQLEEGEVLFGLYRNQVNAPVATHLHSRKRMDEMEKAWAPARGYFAVKITDANDGLEHPIPEKD